jgi:predicted transcriptional regulator
MSHKFFTTNNAAWFPKDRPNGKAGSERMVLYSMIEAKPGISSDELESQWSFHTSMRSRLKELFDKHHVELRRPSDLFGEQ